MSERQKAELWHILLNTWQVFCGQYALNSLWTKTSILQNSSTSSVFKWQFPVFCLRSIACSNPPYLNFPTFQFIFLPISLTSFFTTTNHQYLKLKWVRTYVFVCFNICRLPISLMNGRIIKWKQNFQTDRAIARHKHKPSPNVKIINIRYRIYI